MQSLRAAMSDFVRDWRDDLPSEWATFFGDSEPEAAAISDGLNFDQAEPIIPSRRNRPLAGAPSGAHVFRAFDAITPNDVRVVIIGQDPYPRRERATGRAFEDGALKEWTGAVATSLKHLMQSALAERLNRPELANASGWNQIHNNLSNGEITLEPLSDYFDRLQSSGVMFVNAGWTLTRFQPGGGPEQKAHIAFWRPLMTRLLTGLAKRPHHAVVYLLLGAFAQRLFNASGIRETAQTDGTWDQLVAAVRHPHPNTTQYFASNPLARINSKLSTMQGEPIDW